MVDTRRAPPRTEANGGIVSATVTFASKVFQWLLLALVLAVILGWVGMTWWWPEEGVAHSQRMLQAEQTYIGSEFTRHLFSSEPVKFASGIADQLAYLLFGLTGLNSVIIWASQPPKRTDSRPLVTVHRMANGLVNYLIVGKQTLQVFGMRLAILILALPVLGLCAMVAIVDGLVRRDLRRWGGGRESGFIYHWAKQIALPLAEGLWIIYLVVPFSVRPSFVVLPFAILLGVAITATAATFKKYL